MFTVCFRHLFGSKMMTMSNGSGFVVRGDGLIVTNAHVVANKTVVSIRFKDGRQMEGTVVAVDPVSDLAAIRVNAVRPVDPPKKATPYPSLANAVNPFPT